MGRRAYRGGANTLALLAGISDVATSFNTGSPVGWGDGSDGPFAIVINRGTPLGGVEEKLLINTRTGGGFVVGQRGYDGTTPAAHDVGETVEYTLTAIDLDEANAHVNASTGVHGLNPGDRVVGNSTPATLAGKTISGAANTFQQIPRTASPELQADIAAAVTAVGAEQTRALAAEALLAPKASPVFTGTVTLPGDPAAALQAATKQYVDAETTARIAADALKAPIASPVFTGPVTLGQDAASALQAVTKQQMDALFAALHPAVAWLTPTLGLHIVDYDAATYFGVRYYKDPFGIVRLRGLGKTNAAVNNGDTLFTLPVGSRPGITMVFKIVASGTYTAVLSAANVTQTSRLDILPDGTAILPNTDLPNANWFSVSGISFPAEN